MTDLAPEESAEGDSEKLRDYSNEIQRMLKESYGWKSDMVLAGYVVVAATVSMNDKVSETKVIPHPLSPSQLDRGMLADALDFYTSGGITLIPCEDDDE